jgi:hypothetical protein
VRFKRLLSGRIGFDERGNDATSPPNIVRNLVWEERYPSGRIPISPNAIRQQTLRVE